MSETVKHTPLPWAWSLPLGADEGCRTIKGDKIGHHKQARYKEIAYTLGLSDDKKDEANAALIVKAVNAHDELVTALEETVRVLSFAFDDGALDHETIIGLCIDPYGMLKDAQTILAKHKDTNDET